MTAFSVGPAFLGLAGTSDLCVGDYQSDYGPPVNLVVADCIERTQGVKSVDTKINWEGTISAIFFPIGVLFGSAGILGLIDRRRAALVTAACVLICFAMVVIFFV